ncbi:hypothetical protein ACPA9J_05290 [Pseudomonas aeruginosa]
MKDAFSRGSTSTPKSACNWRNWRSATPGRRLQGGQEGRAQEDHPGRRRPRQTGRLRRTGTDARGTVPGRGRLRRRLGEAGAGQGIPGDRAAARKDPETPGKWTGGEVLASQEVHDIALAIGVDPGASDLASAALRQDLYPRGCRPDGLHIATLLCALFVRHFRPLVEAGHVYVAMPPLYRIDLGKEIYYALDEPSATASSSAWPPRRSAASRRSPASRALAK